MPKKAERNVDKIKRLEKELSGEKNRRRNADIEIIRMHKVVSGIRAEAALQAAEMSTTADGLLIALAMQFGEQVGEARELRLPFYSPTALCESFAVSGSRDDKDNSYVIRVTERGV